VRQGLSPRPGASLRGVPDPQLTLWAILWRPSGTELGLRRGLCVWRPSGTQFGNFKYVWIGIPGCIKLDYPSGCARAIENENEHTASARTRNMSIVPPRIGSL